MTEAAETDPEILRAIMEAQRIIREEEARPTIRFSEGATEALSRDNSLRITTTSGHTLHELIQLGHYIRIHTKDPEEMITGLRSPKTDVAILSGMFLPMSGGKDLSEQMRLLNDFNRQLKAHVPDVKAVMGTVSMYAELISTDRLPYTKSPRSEGAIRTSTLIDEGNAVIDSSTIEHGMFIGSRPPVARYSDLFIVPLIVPGQLRID